VQVYTGAHIETQSKTVARTGFLRIPPYAGGYVPTKGGHPMWRMNDGHRVLSDAEWELFAAGLELLCDSGESDIAAGTNDWETDVRAFDALTAEQKLALLAGVAAALRDPVVEAPRHTAANEGAVAAVFETVRGVLGLELDAGDTGTDGTAIRRLLRNAAGDRPERERKLPSPKNRNHEVWEGLLEEVEGRVFWDRDFEMGDEMLDLPPEATRELLATLTIDPDYYLAVPPEPDEHGLIAARQALARLLGSPVPDDRGLFPALLDQYHGLVVGPCSGAEADAFAGHPWVEIVGLVEPGWDCDSATWLAHFRGAIPAAPFTVSALATEPGDLPDGLWVERLGELWAVRSGDGAYWCGLIQNCWMDDPSDGEEYGAALTFPSESEARAAYLQADRMYGERAARHEAAVELLGLEE
jgi:hypothetical protein